MRNFHYELPRIFDRIGFFALFNNELTVGFGGRSFTVGHKKNSIHWRYENV